MPQERFKHCEKMCVCVCACVWANPSLTSHSRLWPSCASSFEVCSWQSQCWAEKSADIHEAFRADRWEEQIYWLTFYYWRISYGALTWDEEQLKMSIFRMDSGFNRKKLLICRRFTCIHIFDALQMWSPRSPWTPQPAEFWSPEENKSENWMFIFTQYILTSPVWSENYPNLQCNVALKCRLALQILVSTAPGAPLQRHTSRHVGVFHVSGVLLLDSHHLLHGLTHGLCPHLFEPHYCVTKSVLTLKKCLESRWMPFRW